MNRQALANLIFALAACIYGLVFIGQFIIETPWYGAVYWMSQSALIGSAADWFAVTALFTKPLGIPYHTALIPRHRDRFIRAIVRLLETRLLSLERCQALVGNIHFFAYIDRLLRSEEGQRQLRRFLSLLMKRAWSARTEEEWARIGGQALERFLLDHSPRKPIIKVITDVCAHNAHERIIIALLGECQRALRESHLEIHIASMIQGEIDKRKQRRTISSFFLSVAEGVNIVNAKEMAASLVSEIDEQLSSWQRPGSPDRLRWMSRWLVPLQNLETDAAFQASVERTWRTWIREQSWPAIVGTYFCPSITAIISDDASDKKPAAMVTKTLLAVWDEYRLDRNVQSAVEHMLHEAASTLVEKSHPLIGIVAKNVLDSFSGDRFLQFIHDRVDEDLEWIRINGAIVGSVCGLLVFLFLHFLYEPVLHSLGY